MDVLVGLVLGLALLAFAIWAYFIPTIAAVKRQHPDTNSIFIVNLLLGWLLIPWVVAIAWAYKNYENRSADTGSRKCPYCAEMIQPEAIKCRHCHSELLPAIGSAPL